jgi:hypothetical protein
MKTLISFFKGVGITALLYITTVVTPALIGCIIFGSWDIYLKLTGSPDYMAGMSFVSIFVIIIYWAMDDAN